MSVQHLNEFPLGVKRCFSAHSAVVLWGVTLALYRYLNHCLSVLKVTHFLFSFGITRENRALIYMKRAVKLGSEGGGWDRLGGCGKVTHLILRAPMESLVQG